MVNEDNDEDFDAFLAPPSYIHRRDEEPEQIDEDFLPAPGVGAEFSSAPDADHLTADNEGWTVDQGFPDQFRAVRLWTYDDGRLRKVRVSLNWKHRSPSLTASFRFAFALVNNYFKPDPARLPVTEEIPHCDEVLSWSTMAQVQGRTRALLTRFDQLSGPLALWEGQGRCASALHDGVRVTIDMYGQAVSAVFDHCWLDSTATASEIAKGVMLCYQRARSGWQEPVLRVTERGRMFNELTVSGSMLLAMAGTGVV